MDDVIMLAGSSSKKKAGIIGGAVGLVLILVALFLWYKFSRKAKASRTRKGAYNLYSSMLEKIMYIVFLTER